MEAKKIAIACFIGGAICCTVALIFAPFFWWLGIIAGMAGGYISYEFREFIKAIPVAFHRARRVGARAGNTLWNDGKQWLSLPHPFQLLATLVGLSVAVLVLEPVFLDSMRSNTHSILTAWIYLMLSIIFVEIALVPVTILAFIGARYGEKCYWWPFLVNVNKEVTEKEVEEHKAKGLTQMPLTYSNVLRWTAKGVGLIIVFFAWTISKYLGIGIWKTLGVLTRFAWHFFQLIHSSKRVLCALDGTLGGAVAFLWLTPLATTPSSQALLVVFGGLIGAVLGVVHWKTADKYLPNVNEAA